MSPKDQEVSLEIFKRSLSIVEIRDEESSDELRYEFIYVYVSNYTNELWMQTKVLTRITTLDKRSRGNSTTYRTLVRGILI